MIALGSSSVAPGPAPVTTTDLTATVHVEPLTATTAVYLT